MTLVLDGSLTLSWCLPDESTAATDALSSRVGTEGAVVPAIWHLEVANGLLMAIRRGRIAEDACLAMRSILDEMEFAVDPGTDAAARGDTWKLATRHRLSAYDAAYLELALRRRLPLATLDTALARAAIAEGVAILP